MAWPFGGRTPPIKKAPAGDGRGFHSADLLARLFNVAASRSNKSPR